MANVSGMLLITLSLIQLFVHCSLLTGDDNVNSFSVYGKEVDIIASSTSNVSHSSAGSNKVTCNTDQL